MYQTRSTRKNKAIKALEKEVGELKDGYEALQVGYEEKRENITTKPLKKIFENKNVEISRLSYGIPMGAEIDYLDEITLDRALSDRKKIS